MANQPKECFLRELARRYGQLSKLSNSYSLYEVGQRAARVYIRYSKTHSGGRTFYGLRSDDLMQLEGHNSLICLLWDEQAEPLIIPYAEYEDVIRATTPANDGQFKAQVLLGTEATELYIAQAGRFNVESHLGWSALERAMDKARLDFRPELSHPQVQTLLGAIGGRKGFDVWIPQADREKMDWSLTPQFELRSVLPGGFKDVDAILQEVDVVWLRRGSNELRALFEVEHSTPIYSGLLRFNDIHLCAPVLRPRFSVVANADRLDLYVRQINRPTFRTSGLFDLCTFLDYGSVFGWHKRLQTSGDTEAACDKKA